LSKYFDTTILLWLFVFFLVGVGLRMIYAYWEKERTEEKLPQLSIKMYALIALFGFTPSHGEEMARRLGVPFMGRLPLDPRIAELCDAGNVEEYPAEAFVPVAHALAQTAPEPRRSPLQPR